APPSTRRRAAAIDAAPGVRRRVLIRAAKSPAPALHACVVQAGIGLSPKASAPTPHACVAPAGIGLTPKSAAPALLRFDVAVGFADFPAVRARPARGSTRRDRLRLTLLEQSP